MNTEVLMDAKSCQTFWRWCREWNDTVTRPTTKQTSSVALNGRGTLPAVQVIKSVPIGQYRARFERVEETESEKYGPGLAWIFTIVSPGACYDREISRITSPQATTKNACGKMLRGITGRPIGDDVDADDFRGQEYLIVVGETETGGTRVETVLPANSIQND